MEFKTLKEQYTDLIINRVCISKDDLTDSEKEIIEIGYELFTDKLEDIKILNDELKRVSLELANLKAYSDDNEYGGDDNNDEDEEGYE